MTIKLSHSASNKYQQCPAMYKYHYIDRIRPISNSSALYFGSALDEAFNVLLDSKRIVPLESDNNSVSVLENAIIKFEDEWDNKVDALDIDYFKSDIDLSLLDEADKKELTILDPEVTDHEQFIKECFSILSNKDALSIEDQKLYNRIAWECLLKKGRMLVKAYYNDILPQIHTIFDIQKKIELPDDRGNILIGYIDAVVSFIDAPDRKVVLDNKTSSKAYKEDSVRNSPQLATYCEHEALEWASYGVVEKQIRKRKPRTRTQLIIDKIPENTIDETFEIYDNVLEGISSQSFEKNYDSGCYFFGKPCPYYSYCRSDGENKKGLIGV